MSSDHRVTVDDHVALTVEVLTGLGVPHAAARVQGEWLCEGDLRGHASHGIRRLEVLAGRVRAGLIDPVAEPTTARSRPGVLRVDGHDGLGPPAALAACDALPAAAAETGIAVAAIRRSGHLGMLAPYVERLAARGLVGIATTTSEALVHPWGAAPAMIGTNPLAAAVPVDGGEPVVLDMATGQVSRGKVLDHAARGEPLPSGSVVDAEGLPTTDPAAALDGAITPFGGPKGYALALVLELLVASLTHTALGTDVRGTLDVTDPVTKGDLLLAIDPAAFGGPATGVRAYLEILRALEPAPGHGQVAIPGDRARAVRADNVARGVPVDPDTWAGARALLG